MSIKNPVSPPIAEGEVVSGENTAHIIPYKWTFGPDDYLEARIKLDKLKGKDPEAMYAKISLKTLAHMMSCFDFDTKFSRGGYIHLSNPRLVRDLQVKETDDEQ
jgi:hypothetical protein